MFRTSEQQQEQTENNKVNNTNKSTPQFHKNQAEVFYKHQMATGSPVKGMNNKVPAFKVFTPVAGKVAGKVMRYYRDGIYGWIVADTVLEIVNRSQHYETWRLWWVLNNEASQSLPMINIKYSWSLLWRSLAQLQISWKVTRQRRCVIVRGSMDRSEHEV